MGKIWKIFRVPPSVAFSKIYSAFLKKLVPESEAKFFQKYYLSQECDFVPNLLSGIFEFPDQDFFESRQEHIRFLLNQILRHNFNLLGTGWVCRNHIKSRDEIINLLPKFYQKKSEELFSLIRNNRYEAINFWNDPKTGYEWELKFYKSIEIQIGADIKQPWELGRMQHLPLLAFGYYYWKYKDSDFANECFWEFQNEIIDFVATNPVGYSVQWFSSMDVSIRLANWLIACDYFFEAGCIFDKNFLDVFFESICNHILFITENLEWSEGLRGNHYFANIASLILAGTYLPISDFSLKLLAFGINELIHETLYQFGNDGGNFEASTYYHIQVTEMLFLSLYVIFSLNDQKLNALKDFCTNNSKIRIGCRRTRKLNFDIDSNHKQIIFPQEFYERLFNIVKFTKSICKSNGEIEQIGDNDSGYFLRLDYFFDFLEIDKQFYPNVLKRFLLDELLKCLTKNELGGSQLLKCNNKRIFHFPPKEVVIFPKIYSFKEFGLYVVKSLKYELFIRCGSIGQKSKGGHSHNDQLAFTLNVGGNDFFVDPGLFCYTCSEVERNKYRSVHFHNTLGVKNFEQNPWKTGNVEELFWIYKHKTKSKLVSISNDLIVMEQFSYGKPHTRKISFLLQEITIEDKLNIDCEKFLYFHLHPNVEAKIIGSEAYLFNKNIIIKLSVSNSSPCIAIYDYCPQYGLKLESKKLIYSTFDNIIIANIEIL